MEMLFLFVLTYKKRIRGLFVLSLIVFHCFLFAGLRAQHDPDDIIQVISILEKRGEVVFEFFPENNSIAAELNTFISVDRKTAGGFEAYASESGFKSFLKYNIPFRLIIPEARKKSYAVDQDFPGDWDSYPTHSQYIKFMEETAGKYPNICRLDTIGNSVEGRPVLNMKITDNPGIREAEPTFVYSSTMHGNEITGFVLMLRLIDYLCANYGSDPYVTRLVDSIEIWINPLANPDGTYFEAGDSINEPTRFNTNSIDLNRNFPCIRFEDGCYYEQEPETKAQMDFLNSIYMVSGANIHGGKEVINYPFDIWEPQHADSNWYIQASREYADTAHWQSGPVEYMLDLDSGITNGYDWYKAVGTRQDWNNYFNLARAVTIEISYEKEPPSSELPAYWDYNYISLLRYMEHSLFGIQGKITDSETGLPVEAEFRIRNHDTLNSHILSDSATGYFARLIEPGTWDIEVSAPGYEPESIEGIQTFSDQTTWLDISLRLNPTGLDGQALVKKNPVPYMNCGNLYISVNYPGEYSICLYDLKGSLLHIEERRYPATGDYIYPLGNSGLNQGVYILKLISPVDIHTLKFFKSQ